MKTNLLVKAICVSVVAFFLAFVFAYLSKDFFESQKQAFWQVVTVKPYYHIIDESVSFRDIDTLVIQSVSADIVIQLSTRDEGKVLLTTGPDKSSAFHVATKNHRLIINLADLSPYNNSMLTVKVPNGVKSIEIQNSSGDAKLSNLRLKSIFIVNTHGDIKLKNVDADMARLQTVNGDIRCKGEINKLLLKTVVGDIKVKTSVKAPEFQLNTVTGDIQVTAPLAADSSLELQSVNGSVSPQNPLQQQKNSKNQGHISAKSVNGDVRFNQ